MIRVLAINGSPRKSGNVAKLISAAAAGAKVAGAEVELIHLYDLMYTGCISCFACRRRPEPAPCCARQDALTPILQKAYAADVLLIGSPVYFAGLSSHLRAFLERLLYKYPHPEGTSTFKPTGCIYSMNATEEQARKLNYRTILWSMEDFLTRSFRKVEVLEAYDTWQFENYDAYDVPVDLARKARQRDTQFPKDLTAAEVMGRQLTEAAMVAQRTKGVE